jgi:hypothetical protein
LKIMCDKPIWKTLKICDKNRVFQIESICYHHFSMPFRVNMAINCTMGHRLSEPISESIFVENINSHPDLLPHPREPHPRNFDIAKVAPSLASTAGIVDALSMCPLPASLTRAKMAINPEAILRGELRSTNERHRNQLTADLRKMAAIIDARKQEESSPKKTTKQPPTGTDLPNVNTAAVTTLERPPTPRVEPWNEEEDQLEQSIRLVQRTLRGRAVQLEMQQGKDRHIELIRELRAADEAKRREELSSSSSKNLLLNSQAAEEEHEDQHAADYYRRAAVTEATLETIAGLTASAIFDQMQKKRDPHRLQAGDDDDDEEAGGGGDSAAAAAAAASRATPPAPTTDPPPPTPTTPTPTTEEEEPPVVKDEEGARVTIAEAPSCSLSNEPPPQPAAEEEDEAVVAAASARGMFLDSFMATVLAPPPPPGDDA